MRLGGPGAIAIYSLGPSDDTSWGRERFPQPANSPTSMAGPIVKGVAVGVEGLRVSVIMAAYNAARFLDDSIRSVLHQTIDDFELMVIDDASTDGSRALAEGYAGTDSRIRVLSRSTSLTRPLAASRWKRRAVR